LITALIGCTLQIGYVHGKNVALHINDSETDELARDLARRTGETLTVAVNRALKERLVRVGANKKADEDKFVADLLEIAKGAKGLRRQKKTSRQLIEALYDDDGLPR
jgi:antitoxin VapB